MLKDPNLCFWLRNVAVVAAKFLPRIRFRFRDAVWTDANQSGIGLSSVQLPVQCKQDNCNSIGVGRKKHGFGTRWWNVVADQKAGEIKHCSIICLYKKEKKVHLMLTRCFK
jgi:hypothetical protein